MSRHEELAQVLAFAGNVAVPGPSPLLADRVEQRARQLYGVREIERTREGRTWILRAP